MTYAQRVDAAERRANELERRIAAVESREATLRVRVDCYEKMLDAVFRGMASGHRIADGIKMPGSTP